MPSPPEVKRFHQQMKEMKGTICSACGRRIFPPKGACPECGVSLNGHTNGEKTDQTAVMVLLELAESKNGQSSSK